MIGFGQYLERIAEASSTVEVAQRYASYCGEVFGCNSYNYMPIYQPDDPRELVQIHDELSPSSLLDMFMDMMPVLEVELGPVVSNRPARGHVLNLNKRFGGHFGWQKTRTYNEFMRAHKISNQMVSYIAEGDTVIACLCLTQKNNRIYTREQEEQLERITVPSENAILSLLHAVNRPGEPNDIISALEGGLPVMACLFDHDARLQWISKTAARRLCLRTVRISGNLLITGLHQPLEALRSVVRRVAAEPAAALATGHLEEKAILKPGERLSVRRIPEAPGRGRMVLATITPVGSRRSLSPAPAKKKATGLTAREAEVAGLAAEGYSMLNIACMLDIAESTVHTHLKRSYRKLGVSNRAQLAHAMMTRS